MKNVKEKGIEFEEDLQFMNLIEQINLETNKNGIDLFQKLEEDESKLKITFHEDGTINQVKLDKKPISIDKVNLNTSDFSTEPSRHWILASIATVVICYLGYKAYKTVKTYIDSANNQKKKIKTIIKKTNKKCGGH